MEKSTQITASYTSQGCQAAAEENPLLAGVAGGPGLPLCQHGTSWAAIVHRVEMGTQMSKGGWRSSCGSPPESPCCFRFVLQDDGVSTTGSHCPNTAQGICALQTLPAFYTKAHFTYLLEGLGRFYILSSAGGGWGGIQAGNS